MSIFKGLELSNAHMTQKDNEQLIYILNNLPFYVLPFWVAQYEYGYVLPVDSDPTELENSIRQLKKAGFSDAFCNVLRYAQKHECRWINFDRDAPVVDELQTFDW